jgi:hypothetical protein
MTFLADETAVWLAFGLAVALPFAMAVSALVAVAFVLFPGSAENVGDVQRFIELTDEARRLVPRDSRFSTATEQKQRRPRSLASRRRRIRRAMHSGRRETGTRPLARRRTGVSSWLVLLIAGIGAGVPRLLMSVRHRHLGPLSHAEPVARVVAERRFDAVGALGRLRQEGDAATAELCVRRSAVVGFERAGS